MISRFAAVALALLMPVSAFADSVAVTQPWARASIIASRPAAVYLTLESQAVDRLTGVTTPVADEAMVHAAEEENGVTRMVHVPAFELPAGEPVRLAPGGAHVMLLGLDAKLLEGDNFPVTLRFENAPEVTVQVPVLGIAAHGPQEGSQ